MVVRLGALAARWILVADVACAPKISLRVALTTLRHHLHRQRDNSITGTMNGFPPSSPWKAVKTPEGKEYYYNSVTNATSWEKPDELKDEVDVRHCPPAHRTLPY